MTSTGDVNGEVPLSNPKPNVSAEGSVLVRGAWPAGDMGYEEEGGVPFGRSLLEPREITRRMQKFKISALFCGGGEEGGRQMSRQGPDHRTMLSSI